MQKYLFCKPFSQFFSLKPLLCSGKFQLKSMENLEDLLQTKQCFKSRQFYRDTVSKDFQNYL